MKSRFSSLLTFFGLGSPSSSEEHQTLKTFKKGNFSLEYPKEWVTTNENGILNFSPKENFGAVTISSQKGIDFPMEMTRQFIIEMISVNDQPENVSMTQNQNQFEFYYEHIENNLKWITKVVRRNKQFYLITINCALENWEENKIAFTKVVDSFKLN